MNYSIIDFLSLLGAVCLFLYGMKVMSEGLQKMAGDRLRNILGIMTKNRVLGVLTGVVITGLIQSSSASTVMVVSFVNAGLMSLAQSMAVIFGANVGTTATAWIVSTLSFEIQISAYSIVLFAVGVPMLFMKRSVWKSTGEFIIGFCFLFMGLDLISHYVPNLQENPEMLAFLKNYTQPGILSVLIFFAAGIIITMIVQSSSAAFGVIMIICTQGWITFSLACAMILGSNIGTTITPVIASMSGNIAAKRTAMGHVLFNVLGSVIVLCLFYPFVNFVGLITQWLEGTNPLDIQAAQEAAMAGGSLASGAAVPVMGDQASLAFGLAMFPTAFNVCNLLVMIWFTKLYVTIVCKIIPNHHAEQEEKFALKYIGGGLLSASELNIAQAQKEILVYGQRVNRMLGMARSMLNMDSSSSEYSDTASRIAKYENMADRMELEIGSFLNAVAEGKLSPEGKMRVAGMLRIISEIESIADGCFNISKTLERKIKNHVHFDKWIHEQVDGMYQLVQGAMDNMLVLLADMEEPKEDNVIAAYNRERDINRYRDRLRDANISNINNKKYDYQEGIFFMDIIGEAEKLGDYILNVIEGVKHQFKTAS